MSYYKYVGTNCKDLRGAIIPPESVKRLGGPDNMVVISYNNDLYCVPGNEIHEYARFTKPRIEDRVCTCGIWKTKGKAYPHHSDWCDLRR